MFKKFLIAIFMLLAFSTLIQAGQINTSLEDHIYISNRFMDFKSFAYIVAERQRWSLIISNDCSVPHKEVVGDTIREILDNFCRDSEIGWRLVDKCLYIANNRELNTFFAQVETLEKALPDGNKDATYSGYFKGIDLSMLCLFLSSISGTQITVANGFDSSIMMRVIDMNWKRVLISIVHLNRYKLSISDFSVLISPENNR